MKPESIELQCVGCGMRPTDSRLIVELAADAGITADEWVWREEGTLNRGTGGFLCDGCYIAAGMPSSPTGWKVPDGASYVGPVEQEKGLPF